MGRSCNVEACEFVEDPHSRAAERYPASNASYWEFQRHCTLGVPDRVRGVTPLVQERFETAQARGLPPRAANAQPTAASSPTTAPARPNIIPEASLPTYSEATPFKAEHNPIVTPANASKGPTIVPGRTFLMQHRTSEVSAANTRPSRFGNASEYATWQMIADE